MPQGVHVLAKTTDVSGREVIARYSTTRWLIQRIPLFVDFNRVATVCKRVFITNVKGTFFGMSESEEASKRR